MNNYLGFFNFDYISLGDEHKSLKQDTTKPVSDIKEYVYSGDLLRKKQKKLIRAQY